MWSASLFGYRFRSRHVYLLDIIDTGPRRNVVMNRSVFDYRFRYGGLDLDVENALMHCISKGGVQTNCL